MKITNHLRLILKELTEQAEQVSEKQMVDLAHQICSSRQIFVMGKGRSGIAIQGLANRMMHLGLAAYVIGETSTPHTEDGDLLIVGSGSGETEALTVIAQKAKKANVLLAVITGNKDSVLAKMADFFILLPGDSKQEAGLKKSIQPMGSLFEQLSFLVYDALVLELMGRLNQTSEQMYLRHANLE